MDLESMFSICPLSPHFWLQLTYAQKVIETPPEGVPLAIDGQDGKWTLT